MLIPLGTDRALNRRSVVTPALIIANISVFIVMAALPESAHDRALASLWINPHDFRVWGLVTAAFLHAGFLHLLGNMVFLWVFGPGVEDRLGRGGFLAFYLLGAAASSGAHAAFQDAPAIGASGAVAAVAGAFLVLMPRVTVRCLIFFIIIGIIRIPAWWFVAFNIAKDLVMMGFQDSHNIAVLAHLAGYAFGGAVCWALLASRTLKPEPHDLFSMSRQANRRRAFQAASRHGEARIQKKVGRKPSRKDNDTDPVPAFDEDLALARAKLTGAMNEGDRDGARDAYRDLLAEHGVAKSLMPRQTQLDLGNILYEESEHQLAATAYEGFLKRYPRDPDSPRVRLLLGLINARYLNDPVRAKSLLKAAEGDLDEDNRRLARELLNELG